MNEKNRLAPLFGSNIDPATQDAQKPLRWARIADENGLDLISIQDHPYNFKHFETWTLLSALAASTQRVHVGTNVLSTPLRPPAMLAKQAATLDVISGGRLELGLGAGGYPQGIKAFGGPDWSSSQRFQALKEYLQIVQGMWENAGGSFSYSGKFYSVKGVRPGPAPAHAIRIWLGAYGPGMLRLTGRQAHGVLFSKPYAPPEKLDSYNHLIDEGAQQAGRSPQEIRRGYNLMGVLDIGASEVNRSDLKSGQLYGKPKDWVERILGFYHQQRMDTFTFWPVAGDEERQIEAFAREVVPAIREQLA
ncbi:MAG: LLM class flavin-dependent oxidoreductase [Anaerolineales bacterium]